MIEVAPDMFVWMSLESFAPHKNILGNNFPSLGHVTTSSANGITGFVILAPNKVTLKVWSID